MQKPSAYRQWAIFFLAFVFATAWLLRVTHGFAAHAGHGHEHPLCSAAHAGSAQTHLHDERYATKDCPVCAFVFAVPELPPLAGLLAPPALAVHVVAPFFQSAEVHRAVCAMSSRGPPCFDRSLFPCFSN